MSNGVIVRKIERLPDQSLLIRKITLEDQGLYTCRAINDYGQDIKDVQLDIFGQFERCKSKGTTFVSLNFRSDQSRYLSDQSRLSIGFHRQTSMSSNRLSLTTGDLDARSRAVDQFITFDSSTRWFIDHSSVQVRRRRPVRLQCDEQERIGDPSGLSRSER